MRVLWATAALLAMPWQVDAAEVDRRAIVVGATDGGGELTPLRYAESDAHRFADVLTELGSFDADEVELLLSPTAADLEASIRQLGFDEPDTDRIVLFYYSGHADAQGLRLGHDVYPWEELKHAIREIDADVRLGIIDACRAGAITRVKGATLAEPILVDDRLLAEGEAWIAASADDEDAQESDSLGASFFTHYLISGMRGAADVGDDGYVSLNEAYNYAYDRTVARTAGTASGTQHPHYDYQITGNGDLNITDVRLALATLYFPPDQAGEITVVRQPDGAPLAEVAVGSARPTVLAVEPGKYLLRRRHGGTLEEVVVHVDAGAEAKIDRWGAADPEVALAKGVGDQSADNKLVHVDFEDGVNVAVNFRDLHEIDLSHRAEIAVPMSAIVPGSGQLYDGRWRAGILFLGGTIATGGGGWAAAASQPGFERAATSWAGPNAIAVLGTFLYGWSVADAGWAINRKREFGRTDGATVSIESGWAGDFWAPVATGIAMDAYLVKGLTLGLDRTGWLRDQRGGSFQSGARMTVGPTLGRFRPALMGAVGMQVPTGEAPGSPTGVVSGGMNLRFYGTPGWFGQYELRAEPHLGSVRGVHGMAFGVHF